MPIGYQKEIDNNPQSQTSNPFGYILMTFDKEDIVLTSPAAADDASIIISAGHGLNDSSTHLS